MYKIGTDPTKVWRHLSPLQKAAVGGTAIALAVAGCSAANGANASGNSAPATHGTTGPATPGGETLASTPTTASPLPNIAPWLTGVQWPGGRAQLPNSTCGTWSPATPQPIVSKTANVMIVTEDARWNAPVNCNAQGPQADEGGAIYQNPHTADAHDSTTAVRSFDISGEGPHRPQFVLDGQTLKVVDCVKDGTDWSDASGNHSTVWDQVEGEPNGGANGSSVGWESITNLGFDTLPKCEVAGMATPQVAGAQ